MERDEMILKLTIALIEASRDEEDYSYRFHTDPTNAVLAAKAAIRELYHEDT